MHSDDASESPPGHSVPEVMDEPGFAITSDDAEILQQYLEEFEHAETAVRTRLIERAMAELYMLRPPNTPFDKAEISKV
jgi:hypothetical protein